MQKIIHIVLKVLLSLILIMPILGAFHIFPEPTSDMYSSQKAYAFIKALMDGGYILYINAFVFALSLVLLWTKRVALAAILILPITVNIVAFHAFLDGGLLTAGASMGDIMLVLNLYFLWDQRKQYEALVKAV